MRPSTISNRLHGNRPGRAGPFLFARVALDQTAEIPLAVRLLAGDDPRARQPNRANDDAALHELSNAVADGDFVDVDERLAAAGDVHVAELNPAQQRTLEPPDGKGGGQVLIGLADQQRPDAVLAPTCFDRRAAPGRRAATTARRSPTIVLAILAETERTRRRHATQADRS